MDALDRFRRSELSLAELAEAAAELCAALPEVGDERVRAAPDERTLRYYQSHGLIDRPARYEGRQAIYGFRHLVQALAVKALQGQGLLLAQVQTALAGVSTAQLEAAVREAILPEDPAESGEASPNLALRPLAHEALPGEARPGRAPAGQALSGREHSGQALHVAEAPSGARQLLSVELAPGCALTLDPARFPTPMPLIHEVATVVARFLAASSGATTTAAASTAAASTAEPRRQADPSSPLEPDSSSSSLLSSNTHPSRSKP